MKQNISTILLAAVGATAVISGGLFLNSCMIEEKNEQSSSQTQTPQEPSKEDQLQIEKDKADRMATLLDEAREHLQLAIGGRDQCKVALDYALQSGDLKLIQRAKKAVQDSEEQVNESKEIYQRIKNDCSESFKKVLELIKEIKESKEV